MFDLARLTDSGLVARIDYHESLSSTSDRALTLGAEGATELPLLVLAEQQTAGRGRGSNRWFAAPGALTFSLVLEAPADRLPLRRWPQVALAAGVAVADALRSFSPAADLSLKWPNDVFLSGRKVCGILSESVPGWRDRLVVGIGVNVNNREQSLDDKESSSKTAKPIALIDHDGLERDLTKVLLEILDQFDRRWQELLHNQFIPIAAAYRERCLLTGKTVRLSQTAGNELVGVCQGIDDTGTLLLRTERGTQPIVSGTILGWDDSAR
ncbi:MAG: biotin--[acetyl-CoA-carboxylase] ligase [Nitrospira sp.]